MNKHTSLVSWCISIALAISPVVYAAGEGNIQVAKAIGEDTSAPPAVPTQQEKDKVAKAIGEDTTSIPGAPTQLGTGTAKSLELSPVAQALSPTAKIGLAVAGLLALGGGGGGGGGGGSTTPPHTQ